MKDEHPLGIDDGRVNVLKGGVIITLTGEGECYVVGGFGMALGGS